MITITIPGWLFFSFILYLLVFFIINIIFSLREIKLLKQQIKFEKENRKISDEEKEKEIKKILKKLTGVKL